MTHRKNITLLDDHVAILAACRQETGASDSETIRRALSAYRPAPVARKTKKGGSK